MIAVNGDRQLGMIFDSRVDDVLEIADVGVFAPPC